MRGRHLEYNAWAFSMGHLYRKCVYSSFAVNQNEWSTWNDSMLEFQMLFLTPVSITLQRLAKRNKNAR